MTRVELDLYHVMTNSDTKFQVNISKDSREKSGKLKCDGRTDRQTDRQTDGRTDERTDRQTDRQTAN